MNRNYFDDNNNDDDHDDDDVQFYKDPTSYSAPHVCAAVHQNTPRTHILNEMGRI